MHLILCNQSINLGWVMKSVELAETIIRIWKLREPKP